MPMYTVKSKEELSHLFNAGGYELRDGNYYHLKTLIFFCPVMFKYCGETYFGREIDSVRIKLDNVDKYSVYSWLPEWLDKVSDDDKFRPIATSPVITAKYLPVTINKPARYSLKFGNERKIMSIHQCDDVPAQYVAQALVEIWMKELSIEWNIKKTAITDDGLYLFIG